jgi:hypothetical protein
VAEVLELRKSGKLDLAQQAAEKLAGPPQGLGTPGHAPPPSAISALARVYLSRGEAERATRELERATAAHQAAGNHTEAINDALALVHTSLNSLHDLERARKALASVRENLAADADGAARATYYDGLVARDAGDVRGALTHWDTAAQQAAELGMRKLQSDVSQVRARLLLELGRHDEALEAASSAAELADESFGAVARADLATNRAWYLLMRAESTSQAEPSVPEILAEALALYGRAGEAKPQSRANVRVNLALDAVQRRAPAQALEQLENLEALDPEAALWAAEIRARALGSLGRAEEAAATFRTLRAKATEIGAADWFVRAARGEARALAEAGRSAEALVAAREAEAKLADASLKIPAGAGRDSWLAQRLEGARILVELLAAAGEVEAAFAAAREARSRAHRAMSRLDRVEALGAGQRERWERALGTYHRLRADIEARAAERWTTASDKLPLALEEDKALSQAASAALDEALEALNVGADPPLPTLDPEVLTLYPFGGEADWLVFTALGGETRVAKVPRGAKGQALAEQWLAAMGHPPSPQQPLRVLVTGETQSVDVHAAMWDGQPLAATVAVAYGFDIADPRHPAGEGVVVVGDPRGDLPHAAAEAREIAAGWPGAASLLGEAASRSKVTSAASAAWGMHLAAHGELRAGGGWESAVLLAGTERLTASDILALPRAPDWVVLSGCETARGAEWTPGVGMGLGPAFLFAGSKAVVGAMRPVHDEAARSFAVALHEAVRSDNPKRDLVAAFAKAQRALLAQAEVSDPWAYRILVP